MYTLENGKHQDKIARMAKNTGNPIPDKIASKVDLLPRCVMYYEAFLALLSEIRIDGGSIPWSSIDLYAERMCFSSRESFLLHRFVRSMDSERIRINSERSKKAINEFRKPRESPKKKSR